MERTGCGRFIAGVLVLVGVLSALAPPGLAQLLTEADVYVDRGILAYDTKQYTDALQNFQEALRLSPDNLNALYYTGLTYMALQQYSASQAVLEQAQKLAPGDLDVAFQLGIAHFLQQQYERAEPILRRVYAAQPKRPNLGYYLGFMEYRKQNYEEALRLFQGAVPSDENFAQLARFYASLCLSALGYAGQAREQIEDALRLQPASPLTSAAERFKEVLGPAVQAERNFRLDVKLGVYYDTNVAVVPGPSGDIVAQAAAEAPHKSPGELGYVRFEYTPLRTPEWELSMAASLLQTLNNDVSGFNTTNATGWAALAYKTRLGSIPTVAGLSLAYDYFALSGSSYLNQYTANPFMTMVWDATNLTQFQARVQAQDFINQQLSTPEDNRDGWDYMGGLIHFFQFEGGQHYIKLGYQIDWDKAKGSNWTYLGNRFLAGFQYTLPSWGWGIRIRDDLDVHIRNYQYPNTVQPTACVPSGCVHRYDQEFNNLVSISKDLPYNITLSIEYLYDRNISNLALYNYTRNVISFNASWRY